MTGSWNCPWHKGEPKFDITISANDGTLLYQGDGHVSVGADGCYIFEGPTTIYLPPNGWKIVAIPGGSR